MNSILLTNFFKQFISSSGSICGVIFVIVGFLMFKFPAKKINSFYGYRTRSSIKNEQVWKFSQIYAAKEMMKSGIALMIISIILSYFNFNSIKLIEVILIFLAIAIMLFRVEIAIKN